MTFFLKWIKRLTHKQLLTAILFTSLGIILYITMLTNIQPEKLNVTLFSRAEKDIFSPITIEDEEVTIQKRQEALSAVEDQYVLKPEYAQNRVEMVSDLFDEIKAINAKVLEEQESNELSVVEKWEILKENMPQDFQEQLSRDVFIPLMNASPDQLETARDTTITAVRHVMRERIKIGDEESSKKAVAEELSRVNINPEIRASMTRIAQYSIIPNYVYDVKATEVKRQEAIDSVAPVMIRAGQIVVREGQTIDRDIYRQIELLGLLDNETNPSTYIGLALFVTILICTIVYFLQDVKTYKRNQQTLALLYVIILTITLLFMKIISFFQQFYADIGYVVPVAVATMLIKLLIHERIAVVSAIVLSFSGSIIFNNEVLGNFNFTMGLYLFFSAIAGVMFLGKFNHRSKILRAGLFVSFVNSIIVLTLVLLLQAQYSSLDLGVYAILAFSSGIMSAVLTLGLMPFFEAGFGMLSSTRLVELANPNHPLLRKILTEAPGTYHHSIMVANLAEGACEAVGADGFLARVGSYYHDLGKTKRPHFFIENQMQMKNPHDEIAPELSTTIITAHPYDGADLLEKHKFPREIIDITKEHHGTTLLKFFYHKAKQKNPSVEEIDFRYPGPKAQTKESAIVGISDSVEAAVRSLQNPTPEKIEKLVRSIISDRLQDGQFDECDITMKELDLIARSLCETLKGIFHSRIEYPEIVKKKVQEA